MKIQRKETHHAMLPTCIVRFKPDQEFDEWACGFWRHSLPDYLLKLISATGYTVNVWTDYKTGELKIKFTGDTYSREHLPPFCITGNRKFVDKFSDLEKLDDALITKVYNNLIEFIGTLPQPGDRGYEAYKAIHADYEKSIDAENEANDELHRMKCTNEALLYENQKLKKQLLEFASAKAQMAEVTSHSSSILTTRTEATVP